MITSCNFASTYLCFLSLPLPSKLLLFLTYFLCLCFHSVSVSCDTSSKLFLPLSRLPVPSPLSRSLHQPLPIPLTPECAAVPRYQSSALCSPGSGWVQWLWVNIQCRTSDGMCTWVGGLGPCHRWDISLNGVCKWIKPVGGGAGWGAV